MTKYIVIVTVEGDNKDILSIRNHVKDGLELFKEYKGFLNGATYLNEKRNKIIQFLEWGSKESYENCINNKKWNELESSQHFLSLMRKKIIDVDVQAYNVLKKV